MSQVEETQSRIGEPVPLAMWRQRRLLVQVTSWVEVMKRVGSGWGWTITCQQKPPSRMVPFLELLPLGESVPLVTSHNTWI